MKKLVLATSNPGKLKEITALLKEFSIEVQTLKQIGFSKEIQETANTFKGNALLKAQTVYDYTNQPILADDSGLVVEALNGAPGIYSARYAGEPSNAKSNIEKLLLNMQQQENRQAYFITQLCFIDQQAKTHFFEGKINGEILKHPTGNNGFGYDPIFKPNGYDLSFAQMSIQEKQRISHRSKALKAFKTFLDNLL